MFLTPHLTLYSKTLAALLSVVVRFMGVLVCCFLIYIFFLNYVAFSVSYCFELEYSSFIGNLMEFKLLNKFICFCKLQFVIFLSFVIFSFNIIKFIVFYLELSSLMFLLSLVCHVCFIYHLVYSLSHVSEVKDVVKVLKFKDLIYTFFKKSVNKIFKF